MKIRCKLPPVISELAETLEFSATVVSHELEHVNAVFGWQGEGARSNQRY